MCMKKQNKILVLVDTSYWLYYSIYGAVSVFQKKYEDIANYWIKPADETDQSNLPDLINCSEFIGVLKKQVIKRLETIDWLVSSMCKDSLDLVDGRDTLFCMDDAVSKNFRKTLYPEYKAQRILTKKQYNIQKIKDYILNVLFKDLDVENVQNIKFIKVNSAEGDDVIATIFKNYAGLYEDCLLIASDHDFLQLNGVKQVDLMGREAKRLVDKEEVSPAEYLYVKTIIGDNADNIKQVFARVGKKKALNLVRNPDKLKTLLKENQDSASTFLLNKKLISFEYIPKDLELNIINQVDAVLMPRSSQTETDETIDLAQFMSL